MSEPEAEFSRALNDIPQPMRSSVRQYLELLGPLLPDFPVGDSQNNWKAVLPRVLAASDFVAREITRTPEVLREMIETGDLFRPYVAGELAKRVRGQLAAVGDEAGLKSVLRRARRRESVRLAFRDLAGWATLAEVLAGMSALADVCIEEALEHLYSWAVTKHGAPVDANGRETGSLVVLGLGKLGGEELNFSSDVDLMFAYAAEGEVRRRRLISHEFFVRLGQSLINVLSEMTEDGFVFRVDMRLRPNGNSGPLALSVDAMEQYYQAHGREWERYALIKARVVAGDRVAGTELLARLKPFVYRRYLDYGAVEAIRGMKAMINRELQRKGIENNLKLGHGGIREIEFIAQALQLIRGGRQPALQARAVITVLAQLAEAGDLSPQAVQELTEAYAFLRTVENRLQMIAEQQTHVLPADPLEQSRLAFALGFPGWPEFASALNRHRRTVDGHFAEVFRTARDAAEPDADAGLAAVWLKTLDSEKDRKLLQASGYDRPDDVSALLLGLREGPHYHAFSSEARERMDRLMPQLLAQAGRATEPVMTLARLVQLLEAIGRRPVYLSLMLDNPRVLAHVVKLCAASPWIAHWLSQHPILLDELIDPDSLYAPRTRSDLEDELRARLLHIPDEDVEMQLDLLREFRHSHVLRVAAADVSGALAPEQVGAQLAEIAEAVLDQSLEFARCALVARHGTPRCTGTNGAFVPEFAVIAYGKLGSLELGYVSDIDMIFLYEGSDVQGRTNAAGDRKSGAADVQGRTNAAGDRTAGTQEVEQRREQLPRKSEAADIQGSTNATNDRQSEATFNGVTDGARSLSNEHFFARLGQRLIHYLTARTPGGILYEVDMRLRPSGQAGPLVASLTAFRAYQLDKAWTWEHQALVRARPVAGGVALRRAFADVRREILCLKRDPARLRREVREMRARMVEAHGNRDPEQFDVKHDPGGIVDIEFMVQYWVLRWAQEYPDIAHDTENTKILESLVHAGLLESQRKELLVEAYRRYLAIEHRLKLMERGGVIPRAELDGLSDRVERIWREVMNQE